MTTSKLALTNALTADFEKDFIGFNADMLNNFAVKLLALYETQRVIETQKIENSGENRRYYLHKRANKKSGYTYYAVFFDPQTNAPLPTKYSTHTNDFQQAVKWAESNREKCLESYNGKAELNILEKYFVEGSEYLDYEKKEGRKMSPIVVKQRQAFMKKHITPFFQSVKVRYLNQITPLHIIDLKDSLSKSGLTPQTINYNLSSFKKCLELLRVMGKVSYDFSGCSFTMKGNSEAETERDIFDIPLLKGIFKKRWSNDFSKLLCMVIYFCGLRNSEIQRMRFNDIQKINDVYFLNVRGTKSKNAVRKVPIHPTLYTALEKHIKKNGIDSETPIFENVYNNVFRKACNDMGSILGFTQNDLIEKHICYYSGRHTFKTILSLGNDESIGNVSVNFQEMFLGHSFNKKQLEKEGLKEYKYKHLKAEKIGETLLAEKGKEVFKILTHYYL